MLVYLVGRAIVILLLDIYLEYLLFLVITLLVVSRTIIALDITILVAIVEARSLGRSISIRLLLGT